MFNVELYDTQNAMIIFKLLHHYDRSHAKVKSFFQAPPSKVVESHPKINKYEIVSGTAWWHRLVAPTTSGGTGAGRWRLRLAMAPRWHRAVTGQYADVTARAGLLTVPTVPYLNCSTSE